MPTVALAARGAVGSSLPPRRRGTEGERAPKQRTTHGAGASLITPLTTRPHQGLNENMCTIQQALLEPQQRTGAVATLATDHPRRSPLNSSKRPSRHDQIGGAPPDRLRRKIHRSLITSSRAVEPSRSPSPGEAADWSHHSVRRGATTRVAATGSETASNRGYARAACARGISRGGAEALWNSLYPRVMLLEELLSVVETLRGRIAAHGPALRQSEALTRYALIDPLLRGLSWDTADPSQVVVEYRSESGSGGLRTARRRWQAAGDR